MIGSKIQFSVIVPVYNAETFLDMCIQSVLNQTYQNFELILVDDGSKDKSGEICDTYALRDGRIRVLHKSNEGALAARISGIAYAQGEYLIFLDSDDTLVDTALEIIEREICTTQSKCIIYPFNLVQNGCIISKSCDAKRYGLLHNKREIYNIIFNDQSFNSMCCKAIHKSLINDLDYRRYYQIKHGEDLLQSLEILRKATSVCFLETPLYNYRMNAQSATHTRKYDNYKVDFTVNAAVLEFLQKENYFLEEDYIRYRNYCVEYFVDELIMIARFDTSIRNKIHLYQQLQADNYYQTFLSVGLRKSEKIIRKKTKLFFDLFKHKQYRMICWCVSIFDKVFKRKS